MFKKLFHKKNKVNLSKIDYWKQWEFFELFEDLERAENLLNEMQKSNKNLDFGKFKSDFIEHLYDIKGDNVVDFSIIREWFLPNNEWDNFTGKDGKELGMKIFQRADKWKRNDDFLGGTKVSLNNEFGVVIDKKDRNNMYGLIRWDTEKEIDFEDWSGLFGVFLNEGGKIIEQDYIFKFINADGTLKKVCS